MNWYCAAKGRHPLHHHYHDRVYGFPVADDDELFARLTLELNQAGLSWLTILRKHKAFYKAFAGFSIKTVAAFTEQDRERLMNNADIIRNRRKIEAALHNARRILEIKKSHSTFKNWLNAHHPRPLPDWVRLFRARFRFMGPEIVGEFLMSTGYLPGAHSEDCPVYAEIVKRKPPWLAAAHNPPKKPQAAESPCG